MTKKELIFLWQLLTAVVCSYEPLETVKLPRKQKRKLRSMTNQEMYSTIDKIAAK